MNKKKYEVNIDMKWSIDYKVTATNITEAKKKAWEKFSNKIPKNLFEIVADKNIE